MSPYYYTIFSVAIFTFIAGRLCYIQMPQQKQSGVYKFFLLIAGGILVIVAGLRYKVGSDFGGYYSLGVGNLWQRIKDYDEPGLSIINTILLWFTDDPAVAIFTYSAITIVLILRQNYKLSNEFLFVTLLFIFTGTWHGTFNGVRQFLAAAILFAGHRYILNRQFWKYALTVFIAGCFHITAVVMIVLYFLLNNRIRPRNIILLAIGTAILSANYDRIFEFVGLLKDSNITYESSGYTSKSVNIFRTLVGCAPAVFCIVLYLKQKPDSEQTFYLNTLVIHAAGRIATSNSAYLARLGIYTGLFVPIALAKLLKFEDKRHELIIKFGIVILYFIYWYIEVSGSSSLSNFRWIWERIA